MLSNNTFDLRAYTYDKSLEYATKILGVIPFKEETINVEFNNEKLH